MLRFPDDTMDAVNARIALMRLSADKPDEAETVMRYVRRVEDMYTRLEVLVCCLIGAVGGMVAIRFGEML